MSKRLFIPLLILCNLQAKEGERCRLNTSQHFRQPLPIVIRDGQLLEPTDNNGNVDLEHGEILTLSCEGSGTLYHPNRILEVVTENIMCERELLFRNDKWLTGPSTFSQFKCSNPPNYFSRKTTRRCYQGNSIIEVGYQVSNIFYPVYESCFNEVYYNAIYSKYTQKPYNAIFQTRIDRPYFIANEVYGNIPVDSLFSPRGQKVAAYQLVGQMTERYFTGDEFLARGHLAAKTDFVLAFGERATFHYVNCAPQWSGFNGGNWNTLEVDLRNHIHDAGYNTIIYTGTFGVSSLVDQNGRSINIHLYTDVNNNPIIPVPLYFYKVVYEPAIKHGIVFIGINNPYLTEEEAMRLIFCEDVCRQRNRLPWLTWRPNDNHKGFVFCCSIPEFRQTIDHVPPFEVTGILL